MLGGLVSTDTRPAVLALEAAIAQTVDAELVTRWIVVAETFDSTGETTLATIPSPGLAPWVASGMLRWAADAEAGQPRWAECDDDDD